MAEPVDYVDAVQPVEPVEPVPLPGLGAVTLQGDVSINGNVTLPDILFGVIWEEDDPAHVQLWALVNDLPVQVCDGRVIEPLGEPIFEGESRLLGPNGDCHMRELPNGSDIALFIVTEDGQWATSIMRAPDGVYPAPIFGS